MKKILLALALLSATGTQTKPAAQLRRITNQGRNFKGKLYNPNSGSSYNSKLLRMFTGPQKKMKTDFAPGEVITHSAPASTPGSIEYSKSITYSATPKNSIELTLLNPPRMDMSGGNDQYRIKVSKHAKPGTIIKIYQTIQKKRYKKTSKLKTIPYRTITVVPQSLRERIIQKQKRLNGQSTIFGRKSRTGNWRTKRSQNIWNHKLMKPARDKKGKMIYPTGNTNQMSRANRQIDMQNKSDNGQVRRSQNIHAEPRFINDNSYAPWNFDHSSNTTVAPWR